MPAEATPPPTPAEEITTLLAALYDRVETRETVVRYRSIQRGASTHTFAELSPHRTRRPGLVAQLGAVAQDGPRPVRVEVVRRHRAQTDSKKGPIDNRLVQEVVRTEARTVTGYVTPGAALPAGSPGWDADGALSPMAHGSHAEAPEPITDAWHTAQEIDAAVVAVTRAARVSGYRSLVEAALANEEIGAQIAAYLRRLVARARVAAGYDVRIVTLRDICCPECGSDLRVRADASSAVWCSGNAVDDAEECGLTWPRHTWVALLETARTPAPYVMPKAPLNGSSAGYGGRP